MALITLDQTQTEDFRLLWGAGAEVGMIGPRFGLSYGQVYYIARKLRLPARGDQAKNERAQIDWGTGPKRLAKDALPDPIVKHFSGNNSAPMRKLDDVTRKMVDDAMKAGKVQKIPPADPNNLDWLVAELRGKKAKKK